MAAKNKTKQRGEKKTDKNKNRNNKVHSNQQLSSLNISLTFKDTLGFHYQEQLFRASCYMLKSKTITMLET